MTSMIDRLLALPAVFTMRELKLAGLSGGNAYTFLSRARESKRIAYASGERGRAGIYYNLLVDPNAAENRKLEATRKLYPSATLAGPAVLHAAGWITQIPAIYDVIVTKRRSKRLIAGINLLERPISWFLDRRAAGDIVLEHESSFGIATLTPRAALADARQHRDTWVPDADDLFEDDADEAASPSF